MGQIRNQLTIKRLQELREILISTFGLSGKPFIGGIGKNHSSYQYLHEDMKKYVDGPLSAETLYEILKTNKLNRNKSTEDKILEYRDKKILKLNLNEKPNLQTIDSYVKDLLLNSERYLETGELISAETYADKAVIISRDSPNKLNLIESLHKKALICYARSDFSNCISIAQECLLLCGVDRIYSEYPPRIWYLLSRSHYCESNYTEARFFAKLEVKHYKKLKKYFECSESLLLTGSIFKNISSVKSLRYFDKAIEYCKTFILNAPPESIDSAYLILADIYQSKAELYRQDGDYSGAILLYKEALTSLNGENLKHKRATILFNLVVVQAKEGEYYTNELLVNLSEAQEIFKGEGDLFYSIRCDAQLALMESMKGKKERAETIYLKCIEDAEDLKDTDLSAIFIEYLAEFYLYNDEYIKSKIQCKIILATCLGPLAFSQRISALQTIAGIERMFGNIREHHFFLSLCKEELNACLENPSIKVAPEHIYLQLAKVHMEISNKDYDKYKSEYYCDKAIKKFEEKSDLRMLIQALYLKAEFICTEDENTAEQIFLRTLELCRGTSFEKHIFNVKSGLIRLWIRQNKNIKLAKKYLRDLYHLKTESEMKRMHEIRFCIEGFKKHNINWK